MTDLAFSVLKFGQVSDVLRLSGVDSPSVFSRVGGIFRHSKANNSCFRFWNLVERVVVKTKFPGTKTPTNRAEMFESFCALPAIIVDGRVQLILPERVRAGGVVSLVESR